MARKKPGDSLRYTAADWNRHEDAADDYERRAMGSGGGQKADALSVGRILIENNSSADRRRGEILKVGAYSLTDASPRHPWFDAALHDGSDAPFAVLLKPIKNGDVGPAQICGVCLALVNFSHASQQFARPAEGGTDVLAADMLGPVRILHKPAGTGELECWVDLSGGRFERWGVFDEAAAAGETKTVSVHTHAGDTLVDVEAIAKTAFVAGDTVSLVLMDNRIYAGCWVPAP